MAPDEKSGDQKGSHSWGEWMSKLGNPSIGCFNISVWCLDQFVRPTNQQTDLAIYCNFQLYTDGYAKYNMKTWVGGRNIWDC